MDKKRKPLRSNIVKKLDDAVHQQDLIEQAVRRQMRSQQSVVNYTEMLIAPIRGKITAHVNTDEHAPPHIHLKYADEEARFRIDNGRRLPEDEDLT